MSASLTDGTSSQGLHYISYDPGVSHIAVICVHGWGCRAADYEYVFDELVRRKTLFRAIAIDLPGHGKSSTSSYPEAGVTPFANAVLNLSTELQVSDVILIGHSMGVRIILESWKQAGVAGNPMVRGLCFIDGSHYGHLKLISPSNSADPRSSTLSLDQKREEMHNAFVRMFSPNTPKDFQDAALAHLQAMDFTYGNAARMSFITWDHEQMDDALNAVRKSSVPVLNLQGTKTVERNVRVPLEPGEQSMWMQHLAKKIPQLRQVVVSGSGHFPHVDRPGVVAHEIIAFLDECAASPARARH